MTEWVTVGTVGVLLNKYHNNELQVSMTESSTGTMCIHIVPEKVPPSGYESLTIFAGNDDQLRTGLLSLLDQGYEFTTGSVRVTCSVHQLRLRDSKQAIIDCLLKRKPTIYELEKVITDAGIALNYQVDKHPAIFANKGVPDDIHHKLRVLQIEIDYPDLAAKHQDVNRFYNATKHAKTQANRDAESILAGAFGLEIAIDYFETVRHLFIWYYKKYATEVPAWKELEPIDYGQHGSSYKYSACKRWP